MKKDQFKTRLKRVVASVLDAWVLYLVLAMVVVGIAYKIFGSPEPYEYWEYRGMRAPESGN